MTSIPSRPSAPLPRAGPSEFDILKQNHKFLREDDNDDTKEQEAKSKDESSWNEALARKFYNNLWKEYALCDLKHYKSGNFALRWRTEDEVVAGIGESSCANTRCKRHDPSSLSVASRGALHTLELPFGYVEEGQVKSALVKVVLCDKCVKKIMWKRMQEKNAASGAAIAVTEKGEEEMKQKQRAVGEKGAENNDGDTKIYNDAPSDSDLDEEEDERKGNSGSSFKEENRRLAVERQKESDGEAKREREPKRDSEREVRHSELRHLGHHDSHRRRRNYPKGYKSRRKEEGGRRRHSRSRSPNRDDRNRAKGNNK